MANLIKFFKQHQLITYFVLTYTLSWTLWFLFQPLYLAGQRTVAPFISLGIFAPTLVSVGLSALFTPVPRQGTRKNAILVFFMVWFLASLTISLYLVINQNMILTPRLLIVSTIIGLLPAGVASSIFSTIPGIRELLRTYIKPGGAYGYYLLAVLLIPAIWLLGNLLSRVFGMEIPIFRSPEVDGRLLGMAVLMFLYNVAYSSFSEEPGWRGFALPRLQAKFNPLVSSLILGVLWALWHAPLKLGGIEAAHLIDTLIEWILIVLVTITFTWLFNRTKGSILSTALLHPAMNTTGNFLNATIGALALLVLFTVFVVFRDKMWRKLPEDSPARYSRADQRSGETPVR